MILRSQIREPKLEGNDEHNKGTQTHKKKTHKNDLFLYKILHKHKQLHNKLKSPLLHNRRSQKNKKQETQRNMMRTLNSSKESKQKLNRFEWSIALERRSESTQRTFARRKRSRIQPKDSTWRANSLHSQSSTPQWRTSSEVER